MTSKRLMIGDTVICTHDTEDLKAGDKGVIKNFCAGCGGLILDCSDHHHKRGDFELYEKKEPITLNRTHLYDSITKLHARMLFNTKNGFIHQESMRELLKMFYADLDIKEDYFKHIS